MKYCSLMFFQSLKMVFLKKKKTFTSLRGHRRAGNRQVVALGRALLKTNNPVCGIKVFIRLELT